MKKRILATLLVFAMAITSLVPTAAFAGTKKNEKENTQATTNVATQKTVKHDTIAFNDIEYKRPDFESMMKKLDKVSSLTKKKNQYKNITKLLDELDSAYYEARTMCTYLSIMYSKDVTKTDYMTEMNYCTEQVNLVLQKMATVCIQIFESSYGEEFKKTMTEEEIKGIYETQETLTDEYIALSTQANSLNSDYQVALNTTTIDVKGTPMTINELLVDTTLTREELVDYYYKLMDIINTKTGEIYLKLVDVNKAMAKLAGYDSAADYKYDAYSRDYTKEQATQFAQYVKEEIVPLYQALNASLTPEDRTALQSTTSKLSEMDDAFNEYFASINPSMKRAYTYMKKYNLYDFNASFVKQPLTYTTILPSLNEPYIELYPYDSHSDVTGFVHEFGHFYTFFVHGKELDLNLDILEITSQANELLFTPYLKVYGDAYEPITKQSLLSILGVIINGCLYDEFQQYVFANNVSSVKELNELFFRLECEYGLADSSLGNLEDPTWVYVTHTFQMPFYYISYAVSAVPALEIYQKSLTDRDAAIATFNRVVNLGTKYDFTGLIVRSHLKSPFNEKNLDSIADSIYEMYHLQNPDLMEAPAA